jgi:hypothetical protein
MCIHCRYLLNRTDLHNKGVAVDIGAGCGLNVIALLSSGYSHVVATESSEHQHLDLLRDNISSFISTFHPESQADEYCSIVPCDWSNPESGIERIRDCVSEKRFPSSVNLSESSGISPYPSLIVCSEW